MTRSAWKGVFVDLTLIKKFDELLDRALDEYCALNNISEDEITDEMILVVARQLSVLDPIEIWSRRSTILPEFAGFHFQVYNGDSFRSVKVKSSMFFHKFGEFAFTKRIGTPIHVAKKSKKDKAKKKR
jgi:small subunit ribosomal protein S19